MLAVPLLGIGYLISLIDYSVVWRYFSWSNQTLAMIVLWAGSVYLAKYAKINKPILSTIAYHLGIIFAIICLCLFLFRTFIPAMKTRAN